MVYYSAMSNTQIPVPVPRSNILVCPSLVVIGALCNLSLRAFRNKECPISRWNVSSYAQGLSTNSRTADVLRSLTESQGYMYWYLRKL